MCYIHAAALVAEYLKRKGMYFSFLLLFLYTSRLCDDTMHQDCHRCIVPPTVVVEQNIFPMSILLMYARERELCCLA